MFDVLPMVLLCATRLFLPGEMNSSCNSGHGGRTKNGLLFHFDSQKGCFILREVDALRRCVCYNAFVNAMKGQASGTAM